ncbi:MAG: nickel insertion protein, partial [Ilumatobacteraceae bacterium]
MSSTPTGRTAWFHCFAGTAGDMTMAALVHAGADPFAVGEIVAGLPLDEYALTFERTMRCGIAATKAVVATFDEHGHAHHEGPAADGHSHDDHGHDHSPGDHGDHDHDHGHTHHHHDGPHRAFADIVALLEAAQLPARVRDRAI